jgi:hypothetical protein
MRILAALAAIVLAALIAVAGAGAMQNTATTVLDNAPTSGQTLDVTFTVFGSQPVVPYEYALENTCVYPPKLGGHFTLGQHDAVAAWTATDPSGNPQVTLPVYLQSVPSGSSCRVSLLDNNTVVKGSTVGYTVG